VDVKPGGSARAPLRDLLGGVELRSRTHWGGGGGAAMVVVLCVWLGGSRGEVSFTSGLLDLERQQARAPAAQLPSTAGWLHSTFSANRVSEQPKRLIVCHPPPHYMF
jgi:hypothetical protein